MGPNGNGTRRRQRTLGRASPPWRQPSIVLLALGCVVLTVVAYQAYAGIRSHQGTVDRLLADYARVAAWNYRQQAESDLTSLLEHLFHPLHDGPPDVVRRRAPDVRSILHKAHPNDVPTCAIQDVGEILRAVRLSLRDGSVDTPGFRMPAGDAADLRAALAAHARRGEFLQRSEGIVGLRLGERPLVAAYSRQLVGRDTLLYALLLEPHVLGGMLARALSRDQLLPEPLVTGLDQQQLLAVRVEVMDGGEIYRSAGAFPAAYLATERIGGSAGRLQASVGLWPDAAEHLAIGGLPRSRLPVLLALLALAAGLLGVAFVQLRREHELAAMRAGFVSSVSHELRTPLALQRVFLDMLKLGRAETREGRAWAVENLDRETNRLTHLVENVLRFTQTERAGMKVDPVRLDLAAEIREILASYRPLLASGEATLGFDAGVGRAMVSVDRDGFRHVLLNLLENAVKYGPRGQTVRVSLWREGARIVLAVDDQGPGVPAEDRARIWAPFERGAAARRSGKGGSGIGLSVVRHIVALHRGSVTLEDAPGGGARFRVELPALAAAPVPAPLPSDG